MGKIIPFPSPAPAAKQQRFPTPPTYIARMHWTPSHSCRHCGEWFLWGETASGRFVPLCLDPNDENRLICHLTICSILNQTQVVKESGE